MMNKQNEQKVREDFIPLCRELEKWGKYVDTVL